MSDTDKDLPLQVRINQAKPDQLVARHGWRCEQIVGRARLNHPCTLQDPEDARCQMVLTDEARAGVPKRKRSIKPVTERRTGARATRRQRLRALRDAVNTGADVEIDPELERDKMNDPRTHWID